MARSFRLNLSLPEDLHIAIAREAEVSRRPVQDVIREALYGSLMDGCDRQDDLRGILGKAFAAGATNEEARAQVVSDGFEPVSSRPVRRSFMPLRVRATRQEQRCVSA